MKVLLDTSVLVSALVQIHGDHERSFAILDRIQTGKVEGVVAAHSLAELYSVLTKSPPPFRHTPEQALRTIEENIVKYFEISSLDGDDYLDLIRECAFAGIQGGTIYDAILLKGAKKARTDRIYTFNLRHFQSVAPKEMLSQICAP